MALMLRREITLMFVLVLCLDCTTASAADAAISARLHPWGQFGPGAWKRVTGITETLNEEGRVVSTSTTETKTTLVESDGQGVTLEIETCMEVAGKRFEAEPRTVKQGFHGELIEPGLKLDTPVGGEVQIEGRKIPCLVQRLESIVPNGKTVTKIYYSDRVAPYVLKRESVTTDPEGKELSSTNVEVLLLDMPLTFQGQIRNAVKIKTVHRNSTGTVVTMANVLPDVPGGVVSNTAKEIDKTGRLVRRSVLDLIGYGLEPETDRPGLFRKYPNRRTKQPPRYGQ
jgi:hypothetical protein